MQAFKSCPNCGQQTQLISTQCPKCGRLFNTQFSPPLQNDTTQLIYATPPINQQTPNYSMLAELERQYKSNIINSLICIFLGGWTIIGFVYGIYLWSKIESIRLKVAQERIDVQVWEQPLKTWSRKMLLRAIYITVALFLLPILLFILILVLSLIARVLNHGGHA